MMMMGSSDDRISELPVFILHQIQYCLPLEEAARTSVLSKHWYSTWKSSPVLSFNQDIRMKHILKDVPDYQERVDEFLSFIDTSLRIFVQSRLKIRCFLVNMHSVRIDSIPLIDAWYQSALRNGAGELTFRFLFHQKIAYPFSETIFSSTSKFVKLKFLNLYEAVLSEKIIRDITQNCPNIRELKLSNICGIKNLEISKLPKLQKLSIKILEHCPELKRIFVDAPYLQRFSLVCELPCVLDISLGLALKEVTLHGIIITDDIFSWYLSRYSLLESLKINLCSQLRSISISHPRLKFLEIRDCIAIESILIDAPSLSKFTYMSPDGKLPRLSSNFKFCKVDPIFHLQIQCDIVLDNAWFINLKRYLGDLNMRTDLTISFDCNEVNFDLEVLGEDEGHPLVVVDHLDLECFENMGESRSDVFLEGILWSYHPKVITFSTNEDIENCLQRVLCNKLLRSEDGSCCNGTHNKCWHHGLKAAKIDFSGDVSSNNKIHGIEYEQFRLAFDQLSSFQANKVVRFLLEWDYGTTRVINDVTEHVTESDTAGMVNETTNTVIDFMPSRKRKAENSLHI